MKELGVKQDSEYVWVDLGDGMFELWKKGSWYKDKSYSAFLSGELGEMLPPYWFSIEKGDDRWYMNPSQVPEEFFFKDFHYQANKNLAESMGKMLAYLKEKGLI